MTLTTKRKKTILRKSKNPRLRARKKVKVKSKKPLYRPRKKTSFKIVCVLNYFSSSLQILTSQERYSLNET